MNTLNIAPFYTFQNAIFVVLTNLRKCDLRYAGNVTRSSTYMQCNLCKTVSKEMFDTEEGSLGKSFQAHRDSLQKQGICMST